MYETIQIVIGSAAFTAIIQWLLYFRKHKADTITVVKSNDATEIQNLVLMVKEWRETATNWKLLADQYQEELIKSRKENGEKIEHLESKVRELSSNLFKAQKRLVQLEKNDNK